MDRALNYELYKLKKSKYWWICAVIIGVFTLIPIAIASLTENLKLTDKELISFVLGQSPNIFMILICILVTSDFEDGTIKNTVSKGVNRSDLVYAKVITASLLGFLLLVVKFVAGMILLAFIGQMPAVIKYAATLGEIFVLSILGTVALATIVTFISYFSRKLSTAIVISFVVAIFSGIACVGLTLLFSFKLKINFNFMICMPSGYVSNDTFKFFGIEGFNINNFNHLLQYVISMIVFIVGGIYLSILNMTKKDVK